MVPKRPVCSLERMMCHICTPSQECGSQEYVTVQGLRWLKCAVVCYFQGRIFNPTNLLNHVVPCIELMMQM